MLDRKCFNTTSQLAMLGTDTLDESLLETTTNDESLLDCSLLDDSMQNDTLLGSKDQDSLKRKGKWLKEEEEIVRRNARVS